ncbi:hypothetical protein IB239_14670 [Pseudomonas sp. PDM12]|uniref:hypothetical protein n=1 Tax=Pseudomonas sp. PDM12 TaxID=2769260 RepID=UPI0017821A25|nr:hypothetical protein [Pseudomonas sp. PDM12]MBD9656065.1 hypothetical protein [Pseudomonas sp. PDM12]
MKWNKLGIIFEPSCLSWSSHTALQPTPLVLDDRVRVYFGSRDNAGISRIGYVDFSKSDVTKILGFSTKPVLDIGEDGCFDESGVVPSAIIQVDGVIYMFFAGYQLGSKVRFSVLGGLCISEDGGNTFKRAKRTPVFERNDTETLFRVPHSVWYEDGLWKAWYGGGDRFVQGHNKTLPLYDIRYTESSSPLRFNEAGKVLLQTEGEEYRLGRPAIFKRSETEYYLFYGFSTENSPYQLGYAFSVDMRSWERRDSTIGIALSQSGWDSEMMAYPNVVSFGGKTYMFYNGNEYGKCGFGAAELLEW